MRLPDILQMRLRSLFSRRRAEVELDEELQYHVDRQIEEFVAGGMRPDEARRQALLSLGGVEQRKEQCRDARGLALVDNLRADVRFAFRQLGRSPGFAFASIAILSLGMCASVSVFGLVDAALVQPLPYKDSRRLVALYETAAIFPYSNLSYPDYLDWKKENVVLESIDIYGRTGFLLNTDEGPILLRGARVSAGFFRTLGVMPIAGRDFRDGEDAPNGPKVAMLSYGAWQRRFGGRRDIVGQNLRLNGELVNVVGILPREFHFAPTEPVEIWSIFQATGQCDVRRGCHSIYGVGRLKEGVSVGAAEQNFKAIAKSLEERYPDSNRGQGAAAIPLSEAIRGDVRPVVLLLLGGALLLVAIASVNVSSLLLVRSDARRREFAVRSALGASTSRLVSQFATEGSLLVLFGSVAGLMAGAWGMQMLVRLIPEEMARSMPYLQNVAMNARAFAFASAVSLFSMLLFSITPALRMSSSQIRAGLADGGRGSAGLTWRRLGSRLVVVELAIAMILLVGASLLGKSLQRLLMVDLGFRPEALALVEVAAPLLSKESDERRVAFGREVIRRVSELPGVEAVALTSRAPVQGNGNTTWIRFEGRPYSGEHNEVNKRDVSANFFQTVQAKLVRGRYFKDDEDASKPRVAVINQKLADVYFAGMDPIGKRIGNSTLEPSSMREIIGVVENIREGSLEEEIWPAVYHPFNQDTDSYFTVVARTGIPEERMLAPIGSTVRQVGQDVLTMDPTSMAAQIARSQPAYIRRSSAALVGAFAGVAFLMSVVGLYGVVAYTVTQRRREIGVRIALGAEKSSVYRLVMREAAWLTALGSVLGTACSIGAASAMRKMLFAVEPWDAPTLSIVALVLAISALFASYIPARRAAAVNPVEALRAE